jgi:hypothetical protein
MALLVVLIVIVGGGLLLADWWRREEGELVRDRARLRVVEGQLATLRAALRIQAAEHLARQRMHAEFRRSDLHAVELLPVEPDSHEDYRPTH